MKKEIQLWFGLHSQLLLLLLLTFWNDVKKKREERREKREELQHYNYNHSTTYISTQCD